MARPRKMTTEQMIAVVDSYYLTRADDNEKKLKCSLIAAYAVELGYQANDYDFTRNMEVREHIERLKCYAYVQADYKNTETIVPAYKSLDIGGILRNTKGKDNAELIKSLSEMDEYWQRIYQYAEKTAVKNKDLMKEKSGYEDLLKSEVAERESVKAENSQLSTLNNKLVVENRYLRKMLRLYLYPAIANEVLMKEGVLKECDTNVTDDAFRDMTELNIPQSLSESVVGDMELLSEEEALLQKMWGLCDGEKNPKNESE